MKHPVLSFVVVIVLVVVVGFVAVVVTIVLFRKFIICPIAIG